MSEGEGDSDFRDDSNCLGLPVLSGHPSCHLVSPEHIPERQTPINAWSTALFPHEPKDTQTPLWVQPEFQTGLCPRGSWSSVWLPCSFLASAQSPEAAVRRSPAEGPGPALAQPIPSAPCPELSSRVQAHCGAHAAGRCLHGPCWGRKRKPWGARAPASLLGAPTTGCCHLRLLTAWPSSRRGSGLRPTGPFSTQSRLPPESTRWAAQEGPRVQPCFWPGPGSCPRGGL